MENNDQTAEQSQQPVAYIAGIGMVTPLGDSAELTAAAVNAGISAYQVSDYYNENDQPVTMSLVPGQYFADTDMDIEEGSRYGEQDEHVIKMAISAIREALGSVDMDQPVPLILAFPEPGDHEFSFPANLVNNLLAQQDLPLAKETLRTLHTGRAAGLEAIALAMRYLYDQHHDYVLIGASDSFFNCSRLSDLSSSDRLLAAGNMDGFVPGEAAGFLLLTRNRARAMMAGNELIALSEPGMAEEKGSIHNEEETHTGDGLDKALKRALANQQQKSIAAVYASMNGERYWSKEHGVAMLRNHRYMADDVEVEHPADCYGDLGAASGPVLTGLAALALLTKTGRGKRALVYCASEGPERAALCLQRGSGQNVTGEKANV